MNGGDGNDILNGGDGDDILYDDGGSNRLIGELGNDLINATASTGNNVMFGGGGNDTYLVDNAKDSVREVQILEINPDERMGEMARLLDAGAQALLLGFSALERDPTDADGYAEKARKVERAVEKVYRRALASLFDPVFWSGRDCMRNFRRVAGRQTPAPSLGSRAKS